MVIDTYQQEAEKIKKFLVDYQPFNGKRATVSYTDTLMKIAHRDETSITIELDHVLDFDETLAFSIMHNTKRYVKIFSEVIQELLPRYRFGEVEKKDFLDIYIEHRTIANQHTSSTETSDPSLFPKELLRRFDVYFGNITSKKIQSIREIKADSIGKLVTVSGIITRSSDVKPLVCVATYVCDKCGAETYQPVGSSSFLPLDICPSKQCTTNKLGGRLYLQTRGSKFTKHQEVKIQEHSDHAPVGSVPRSMVVLASGNLTRKVLPGNHVQITGVFLPAAKTGFKQILQGLISDTYLEAHTINVVNKNHADTYVDENIDYDTKVAMLLSEPNLYEKLAYSISPEIYGHEDIKKALLLLLVGGVSMESSGMKIRGNINILLMGDPGVAKSQLLSYIDRLAYRSQLTTGKGSSGVGLTAAVVRDSSTGDITLEGGALILADQGVCCIDEFDKMDENDRTAIHEVMEQQTVSIAKAGISTTLNARVSILAAANPVYGRYNVKKSIEHNIQLPAALLSRFDLIWLIRDKVDPQNDQRLAQHIAHVHKHLSHPTSLYEPIPMDLMRKFVSACQKKTPTIPQALMSFIVSAYVEMRKDARKGADSSYISARTLLSIIRLSTALARLRMADYVEQEDISEAIRLIEFSKASILPDTMTKRTARPQDAIYAIIRDLAASQENSIDLEEVKRLVMSHGYTLDQFEQCVNDYQELNVWLVNSSQTKIQIIS